MVSEKQNSFGKSELGFSWRPMPFLTKTKTYFQHYGPHEGLRGGQFVATDSELFLFGCRKNSTISPLDGLSNDIKVPGEILCSARPQEEVVALVLDFHLGVFIFQ